MGKDAYKLLTTVDTTIPENKGVLITEGYRGTMCRTVCLQRLVPICLCPRSATYNVRKRMAPRVIRGRLGRAPSVQTIIVASPACSKIMSSVGGVTSVIRTCKVPLVISRTRKTRFKFSPRFPRGTAELNTSTIVVDMRGALPTFARATLLRLYSSQVTRGGITQFLKVCRADSPSCLLVTKVRGDLRVVRGSQRVLFTTCDEELTRFQSGAGGLGALRMLRPSSFSGRRTFSFSPKGLLVLAKGDVDKRTLRRVLLQRCNLRVRVTDKGCMITVASVVSASRKFTQLSSTLRYVSKAIHGGRRAKIVSPQRVCQRRGAIVAVSRTLSTRRGAIQLRRTAKRIDKSCICLCPPKVPVLIPNRTVSIRATRAVQRYVQLNLRMRKLPSLAYVGIIG